MPTCIIAYIGEGERYWPLVERSIDIARSSGARLVLYDADAGSGLGAPLPTWWSGDGAPEQFGNRLGPVELEKAGREELRDRVIRARDMGVDAYGWLPKSRGAKDLAEYASEQRADLLIIPSELEQTGLTDWLKGRPSADDIATETNRPIIEVDLEQRAGV